MYITRRELQAYVYITILITQTFNERIIQKRGTMLILTATPDTDYNLQLHILANKFFPPQLCERKIKYGRT